MDGLRLPMDPRTLEASVSSRKLRAIDIDGSLIYENPDSSDNRLTERLGRIWDEYPNGLLDLTEARLAGVDPNARAIEEDVDTEEDQEEFDRSKPMTYHDMQKIRDELCDQLNTARNELWFALELAKTLSVSSEHTIEPPAHPQQATVKKPKKVVTADTTSTTKGEPPVLPSGSYTTTPASVPPKSKQTQIIDYELALAAKHQALDECSALIDAAVEELQLMADAGSRFWRDIRQLKDGKGGRGRWAIVPKPDFTRTMLPGEKAKDVVIPYAVDEASSSSRVRSLAAFDLDPTKADPLSFGSRGHRRLRVTLQNDLGAVMSVVPSHDERADIHNAMEAAQLEALDEDLYVQLQNETASLPNGTVSSNAVTLIVGPRTLIWEMCDTRTCPAPSETSTLVDAIVLAARLSLLHYYRRRKARIIGQTAGGPSVSQPILQPIIQLLQFQCAYDAFWSVLQMYLGTLSQAGIEAKMETFHPWADADASDMLEKILAGQGTFSDTSMTFKLDLAHCRGITVCLSMPSMCRITTSVAEFAVPDLSDLASILSEDLAKQLLLDAQRVFQEATIEDLRSDVFFDELEGAVRLPAGSTLRVTIPPPYSDVRASVDGAMDNRYDSSDDPDLANWLRRVASEIASTRA